MTRSRNLTSSPQTTRFWRSSNLTDSSLEKSPPNISERNSRFIGMTIDAIIETPSAPPCRSCKSSATKRSSAYIRDSFLISPFLPAASAHASVPLFSRTPTCSENAERTHFATSSEIFLSFCPSGMSEPRGTPPREAKRSSSKAVRQTLRAFTEWIPKSRQNFSSNEFSRATSQSRAISSGSEATSPTSSSRARSANASESGSLIVPQSVAAAMRETSRIQPRRAASKSILA